MASLANATPVSPVVVDGRLRVEFTATKDITPGKKKLSGTMVYVVNPWFYKPGKTLLTIKLCLLIFVYSWCYAENQHEME